MNQDNNEDLKEYHLKFAKSTNNRAWNLLEKEGRSPSEGQEMLLAAFASLYHWINAGTAVNIQRGYWMLSRVHQVLDQGNAALEWALKCQEVTEAHYVEMADFDLAFTQESLARSFALIGDHDKAKGHYELAEELGKNIKDLDDREVFSREFNGGNWYQLFKE